MRAAPSLLQTVAAELRALDVSARALRQFGLVVGAVLLAVAAVLAWRAGWSLSPVARVLLGGGGTLVLLGAVAPRVLRPVHRVWMALAFALGFVMTRVILTLAFALAFVPMGLVLRLLGKDLLRRRLDPEAESYWIPRADGGPDREQLERYF
ncbi:MAG: SxtJ family membrane protein [Bacteroidota bacterium]